MTIQLSETTRHTVTERARAAREASAIIEDFYGWTPSDIAEEIEYAAEVSEAGEYQDELYRIASLVSYHGERLTERMKERQESREISSFFIVLIPNRPDLAAEEAGRRIASGHEIEWEVQTGGLDPIAMFAVSSDG